MNLEFDNLRDFYKALGAKSKAEFGNVVNDGGDASLEAIVEPIFTHSKAFNGPVETANFQFGTSVAIDGNVIVVGAKGAASSVGEAYVFYKDTGGVDNWGYLKTIVSPSADAVDLFGISVAISGDVIVIGAYFADGAGNATSNAGEAYVYYKDQGGADTWGHKATLNSPNEDINDNFGKSVAISGDVIVVGAHFDDGSGDIIADAGEAYVFHKDEGGADIWGLKVTLNSPNEDASDIFGSSVAIDGDVIVIGATGDDGSADLLGNAGEAYVFYKDEGGVDTWGLKVTLNSTSEDAGGDLFGKSVAISGDVIVVGAHWDDGSTDLVSIAGEAYVFYKDEGGADTWGFKAQLNNNTEDSGDVFGTSVAISGDVIVVGATGADGIADANNNAGEVCIFYKDNGGIDTWGFKTKINSDNEDINDNFGISVAISGDVIVVGAAVDDGVIDTNSNAGEAHIFVLPTTTLTYPDAVVLEDQSDGAQVKVQFTQGLSAPIFTGLTIGADYYITSAGALTTTVGTNKFIGTAMSTTEILFKG